MKCTNQLNQMKKEVRIGHKPGLAMSNTFLGRLGSLCLFAGMFSLLLSSTNMAQAHRYEKTRLNGTLTIDFQANQPAKPVDEEIHFVIPNKRLIGGMKIPKEVRGFPFRGQEFKVKFNQVCSFDYGIDSGENAGLAHLRLTHKQRYDLRKGSVFKATVMKGAADCLERGDALVTPYDPFMGDAFASSIGEIAIWLSQIYSDDPDGNGVSNEAEIREFFRIPSDRKEMFVRLKYGESGLEKGQGCFPELINIKCSRTGSAMDVYSFDVRLFYRQH